MTARVFIMVPSRIIRTSYSTTVILIGSLVMVTHRPTRTPIVFSVFANWLISAGQYPSTIYFAFVMTRA